MFPLSSFIIIIILIISPEALEKLNLRKAMKLLDYHVSPVLDNSLLELELPEHEQEGRKEPLTFIMNHSELAHRKIMSRKTEIHNGIFIFTSDFT